MYVTLHPLATTDQSRPPASSVPGEAGFVVDLALAARLGASFRLFADQGDTLARRFYDRLFAAHPGLRRLFPEDLTAQRGKLMATLEWVATHLADRPTVLAAVGDLGRRHGGYGARPEHFPPVIDALLAAMRDVAGDRLDPGTYTDWETALRLIGERMAHAAQEQGPAVDAAAPTPPPTDPPARRAGQDPPAPR